jgi:hypothetical protein
LKVSSEIEGDEVFELGASYIQKSITANSMKKGSSVCIEYLTTDYIFLNHFVTQIYLNKEPLLDPEKVIKNYTKGITLLEITLVISFLLLCLFFLFEPDRK